MVMTAASTRVPGALMEIPHVAAYLGQPLHSVRRWIHRPPEGFPTHIRIGRKIVFRTAEIEKWALGGEPKINRDQLSRFGAEIIMREPNPSERRTLGRPPKQPRL